MVSSASRCSALTGAPAIGEIRPRLFHRVTRGFDFDPRRGRRPAGRNFGTRRIAAADSRLGIVVLQFDDGTSGHYTHAFRILEKYGLKGSFGVVTGVFGRPGRLTAGASCRMHRAGREIHDHTLDHNAAFWGNPQQRESWKEQIDQSLGILKQLGITTRGWNQPGGQGQAWTPELRDTLAPHYNYVAGRVGLKADELHNMHWNLKDDPFCLGYGGVGSWPMRGTKPVLPKKPNGRRPRSPMGYSKVSCRFLWHVIGEEDGSAWGLEEICKFLQLKKLPVTVMADAVRGPEHAEALPCHGRTLRSAGRRINISGVLAWGRKEQINGHSQRVRAPGV